MKIIIINGPNLNLLGKREPQIYGEETFEAYFEEMKKNFSNVELSYFQSNIEGEIVDKIQEADYSYDGIVINAGGYSHTSVAIRDALAAVSTPAVEVHISNVFAREDFRHTLLIAPVCRGCITGMGLKGYYMAVESFVEKK